MDALKDFDFTKALLFVVPGALFALARSFTLRGIFPTISKDDVAALVLTSTVYHFVLLSLISPTTIDHISRNGAFASGFAALITIVIPAVLGVLSGSVEVGDWVGKAVRSIGLTFRSPTQTAWETLFTELQSGSFLLITLKNGGSVYGRWIKGSRLSAASTDTDKMDIFVAEVGYLSPTNKYLPKKPPRGIYIAAGEIRLIEVI